MNERAIAEKSMKLLNKHGLRKHVIEKEVNYIKMQKINKREWAVPTVQPRSLRLVAQ